MLWFPRGEKQWCGEGVLGKRGAEEEKRGPKGLSSGQCLFFPIKDLKHAHYTIMRMNVILKTLVWSS